ncbi:MAG: hypothetical protein O3C34_02330 [Proteobacteria bacterium]|nr:hypothetical protein [Pseudomonadota bacterium]
MVEENKFTGSDGEGNDGISGGSNSDTIVLAENFGDDVVRDFSMGDGDKIDMPGTAFSDLDTLMASAAEGGENFIFETEDGVAADNVMALDLTSLIPEGADPGTHEVVVSGLPVGATLSSGDEDMDRNWTMTIAQVIGLTIAIPTSASAAAQIAGLSVEVIDTTTNEVVQTATFDADSFDEANHTISLIRQGSPELSQAIAATGNFGGNGGVGDGGNIPGAAAGDEPTPSDALAETLPAAGIGGGGAGIVAALEQAAPDPTLLTDEIEAEETVPEQAPEDVPEEEPEAATTLPANSGGGRDVGQQESPPANQAPTDLSLSADTVAENAANGTMVGIAAPTDPDAGDSFTYTLVPWPIMPAAASPSTAAPG